MEDLLKLKYRLNYEFGNIQLLKEAMTHRSYSAENDLDYDNQRLEYLGDAVIEIILSDYLYHRYPSAPEGLLTRMRAAMVQQEALALIARQLNLDLFIRMGKGEIDGGGMQREAALCDVFEALVGAVYLDAGMTKTAALFLPLFEQHFPDPEGRLNEQNPKGSLQELAQRLWNKAPEYQVVSISGPDHDPVYKVSVSINRQIMGEGEAGKRKTAESIAARNALANIDTNRNITSGDDHDPKLQS